MTVYKISPSDLTFTWDECKFCFYMKVKHGMTVKGPFPGIFTRMANLTSCFYAGKPASEIAHTLPPGIVKYREQFVRSEPISFPGLEAQGYLYGRFDAVIAFEDGTYGIVDYKTSEPKDEHAAFYSRQLTAYAHALEHPAPRALHLSPVSRMGLFVITPDDFDRDARGKMVFTNRATWMEVPRDDVAFMGLIEEVLRLLDAPEPPEPSEECGLCQYRQEMRNFPG